MSHPEPHPEPDVLAAYHAGELTEPEERRLQDHLVGCPECAALLLDLDGLADPGFGAGSLAPADQKALWRGLQAEIRKEEAPVPLAPVVPLRRRTLSPPWLPALAAALLMVTIGLSAWVASLQRKVDALSRPQLATQTVDLYSSGSRSEGSPQSLEAFPANVLLLTVILHPEKPRSTRRYRVQITRADGEGVWTGEWRGEAVRPDPYDPIPLGLPRGRLGPGSYRIHWIEETGQRIGDYELQVPGP